MSLSLEYIAGFFDGEGCVSLSSNQWQITATQTVKNGVEPLMEMQTRWGGSIVRTPGFGSHSECWAWKARGVEAAIALYDMAPFLRIKLEKATKALQDLSSRHNGKIGRILNRLSDPPNVAS